MAGARAQDTSRAKPILQLSRHGMPLRSISGRSRSLADRLTEDRAAARREDRAQEKRLSISPCPGNLRHQRESTSGPAGGGGRGTDDDCTADDCALGCGGLGCGIGAACGSVDGGANDIFCLISSSTACSDAMFCAIWSCLAASCSTLRRTTSRLDAKGSSCCTGAGEVAATAGDLVVETDNNQAIVGARAITISLAASP